jgi:thiol-disulfide isomerase/thioredoxin
MPVILKIFVAKHCPTCQEAYKIATHVAQTFPTVDVKLIDVGVSPVDVPDNVFATPTFILNDRIISLGNPSLQDVTDCLHAFTRERISQESL